MASKPTTRQGMSTGGERPETAWRRPGNGRAVWVSSAPAPEVIGELVRRYPEVVQLPEEEVRRETEEWRATALVARSMGRRVAAELAVREFRARAGVKEPVLGFNLEQGHLLFRFADEDDRDAVLRQPWVVAGQSLAVEPWRPRFHPSETAIRSALVWIRIPQLPAELWGEAAIRNIVLPAGEFVALDAFTVERRRLGFARVCVRIDLGSPLRPGVLIDGPEGPEWQSFIYEGLDGVCLRCGRFHAPEACPASSEGRGPADGEEFGPWLVAVRRWLPEAEGGGGAERRGVAPRAVPGPVPAPAGEPGGWQRPARVARRRPLARGTVADTVEGAEAAEAGAAAVAGSSGNPFRLLADCAVGVEAGLAGPRPTVSSLGPGRPKQASSFGPQKQAFSSSLGAGPSKAKRARPSDLEVGRALEGEGHGGGGTSGAKPSRKSKGKGKARALPEPGRGLEGVPGEYGVFGFAARASEAVGMVDTEMEIPVQAADHLGEAGPSVQRLCSEGTGPEVGTGTLTDGPTAPSHEAAAASLRQVLLEGRAGEEQLDLMDVRTGGGGQDEGGSSAGPPTSVPSP